MNGQLKAYFRVQAVIAAAFNFFINGMIAGLIYHAAAEVPTNIISIAIDLIITCLLTFTITAFFVRAGLKSTKTAGILPPANRFARFLARLFRAPLGFGVLMGLIVGVALFIVIGPAFTLAGISTLPFYIYVPAKSLFSMLLGSGVTIIEMYAGMRKTEF